MNVQGLEQTSVTPTLCVTTPKVLTCAAVVVDIRVMVKTAQVSIPLLYLFGVLCITRQSIYEEFNKRKLLLKAA